MTQTLVSAFKALFPALIGLLVLAVLGCAVRVYTLGYGILPSVGLAVGGLLVIVAVFGIVALQIENNALLTRIARASERQGAAPRAETDAAVPVVAKPRPAQGGRAEPPIRRG
jgi:hypothetical protein